LRHGSTAGDEGGPTSWKALPPPEIDNNCLLYLVLLHKQPVLVDLLIGQAEAERMNDHSRNGPHQLQVLNQHFYIETMDDQARTTPRRPQADRVTCTRLVHARRQTSKAFFSIVAESPT
jgi:hypothetical protein